MKEGKLDFIKERLRKYQGIRQYVQTLEVLLVHIEKNRLASSTSDYEKMIEEYSHRYQESNQECERVLELIHKVDGEIERSILIKKYILGETWESISEELNYSLRQIYNIHNKSLTLLYECCKSYLYERIK